ncbi:MAG: hypothetical protein IT372_02640 [Polyangiaceae bacterium]|nr:hypothetical protein [Polyangiaceae bacterium]
MNDSPLPVLAVMLGALVLVAVPLAVLLARCYRRVDQGTALVITVPNRPPRVSFTGALVLPFLHHAESIGIGVQRIEVSLRGAGAPSCNDGVRVSADATLLVRINPTTEDVLKVAQTVGCKLAADTPTLEGLFRDRVVAAIETVFGAMSFEDVLSSREHVRDQIIDVIGIDLDGYRLDDLTLSRVEIVPVEEHDPNNPRDAMGIRKLTELAAAENVRTNELRKEERLTIQRQNLEAELKIRELDREREEAEAKLRG